MRATLLDVEYGGEEGKLFIYIKEGNKRKWIEVDFKPYLLVSGVGEKELKECIEKFERGFPEAKVVGKEERFFGVEKREFYKVEVDFPQNVPQVKKILREMLGENLEFEEFDIPFKKRVLIDLGITPLDEVDISESSIKSKGKSSGALSMAAFDIEVYNPQGMPRPNKDPIIMASYKSDNEERVISYKGKGTKLERVKDEEDLLEKLDSLIENDNPDILLGYNSSQFDLPYIEARAKKLGLELSLLKNKKKVRKGLIKGYKLGNNIHIDLYYVARLLSIMGAIESERLTLKEVYNALFGEEKMMVERLDIWKMWDDEKSEEKLAEYALGDAIATYKVGKKLLPLEIEMARESKTTLFDASVSTSGQLVESRLMYYAAREKHIIPRKPKENEVRARMMNPIQGAFVKLPKPGIYKNIAVLDFRGLYPSIIISYNIDPFTLTDEEEGVYVSPLGHKFRKEPKGLVPRVLEELIEKRAEVKKRMKKAKGEEKVMLNARNWALKVLANSFYGYLGYARSRWYSRECAESTTAWGREHINKAIEEATNEGFKVLYADTDSLFLLMGDKSEEDVLRFMEEYNKKLPEKMELELENFYTRAVFVSKKSEEKGAKKKYAMLAKDGSIKIRGFELVRRDWSEVARETQRKVLEAILKEGSKDKAISIVREAIKRIKSGKEDIEKLAITTQINKRLEDYEAIGPEVVAARRLKEAGKNVVKGSIIRYVITKRGSSISDKAYPLEMAKDYDPDYYIKHQILPAVMKILKELGVDEELLISGTRQGKLSSFF